MSKPSLRNRHISIILFTSLFILVVISTTYARRLNLNTLDKDAAPEVVKCVQDAKGLDAAYRAKCADLLARWREKSAQSAFEEVLKDRGEGGMTGKNRYSGNADANKVVRISACYGLAALKAKSSIPVIVKTLKEDYNAEVRVAAAVVLQRFQSEAAVDGLIDALLLEIQKDSKATMVVVKQVVRSLGVIGHKKAFIPLLKATQVSFPDDIKEDAQHAIENIQWNKDFNSSGNNK